MNTLGVIYKATNKINGKSYIGQTIYALDKRRKEHERAVDDYPFHQAIRKYGAENFDWEILEQDIDVTKLDEREMFWIEQQGTYSKGYNATRGGDNANALADWKIEHPEQVKKNALNALQYAQQHNKEHRGEHLERLANIRPLALAARRRKVRCVDLDLIFESLSAAEAWSKSTENPNKKPASHQHISKVCNGQRKTAGGYHWQYIE